LSETREDRALTLINLSDETQPEGGLLRCYGQMMNVPVQRWDVAGPDDWTAPRGGATQIIDMACTGEEFQDLWPTLRQHFSGRRVHVVLAMPSGAAAARISSELALYQPQSPEVVLTKLDECECSLPEMSQFLVGGARVGWLSGTRNLLENLAQATTDILEQYLQYSLQLTAQPHSTKAAQ
jgi:flagellar biosynthesis protein FlhF